MTQFKSPLWGLVAAGAFALSGCHDGVHASGTPTQSPSNPGTGTAAATGRATSPSYVLDFTISNGVPAGQMRSTGYVMTVDGLGGPVR